MKGGAVSYTTQPKRRWRGLVIAVLGLVFLSMLVPLVFLLGLHNGFHPVATTAYGNGQHSSRQNLKVFDQHSTGNLSIQSKEDKSKHVDDVLSRLVPSPPKEPKRNPAKQADNKTVGLAVPTDVPKPRQENNPKNGAAVVLTPKSKVVDESEKSCEIQYGSYCLWRREHKEVMKDHFVKKMKDDLYVARAYFPSIAKLPAHEKLSRELKQNIQEFEKILSEATTDVDLPPQIEKKLEKMETVIARVKSFTPDCNNVDKKLRQLVDLTEDEANFHSKQSAFMYQLAVQTMPKSFHCLSMRLTVEYFRSPPRDVEQSLAVKYKDPELQHYVIFSKNVLASSVVINSTVLHAKESRNLVFHVLTDKENYFSMKLWFFNITYKEAIVQVLNMEDTGSLHQSFGEEFRISFQSIEPTGVRTRTEYVSVFSFSHSLLPKVFTTLKKVVVLGDDTVVQRDLSALWGIDMRGKVNGAVQSCAIRLGQLKNYLGKNVSNGDSCAWMSGLNIIDLDRWRKQDLTNTFQKLAREKLSRRDGLYQTTSLRASQLTFQGQIHALDDSWMLSGLGHDYNLDMNAIKKAAVLHYNGNMKPWIEMGISKYKVLWKKYMNEEIPYLSDCNVNP